jgi:hypothetical protein
MVQNPSQEKKMSPLEMLQKINAMAEFNRWCGIEVTVAELCRNPDALASRGGAVLRLFS